MQVVPNIYSELLENREETDNNLSRTNDCTYAFKYASIYASTYAFTYAFMKITLSGNSCEDVHTVIYNDPLNPIIIQKTILNSY